MIRAMRKYIRETAATIMVAFALMGPIVVGGAGMALDYTNAYLVQQRLLQALDAAALAAAAASTDPVEIRQRVLDFFAKNYPPEKLGATVDPTVVVQGNTVTVSGSAHYITYFLTLIGIDDIDIDVETEITRTIGNNIELALVVDVSGSMNSYDKIADLKEAAQTLVDIVVYDDQTDYYSKVAIVPYSVAVNAGSYATAVRGPIHSGLAITGATKANPVVITANNHGFTNGQKIHITGVSGMTQINNKTFTVANKTANTFQLQSTDGRNYSTYRGSGNAYCTSAGCEYYYFQNPSSAWRTHQVSTCVSERTGSYAYTDDPPSTAFVGRNYPVSTNPCISNLVVPLTNDRDELENYIDALVAGGSTGGQVGVGWGYYMLSPNFGADIFPEESVPAAYHTEKLKKVLVLMTDGEYNSPYCQGVIAKDATSGSGNDADHINCNAHNGNAYDQAEEMCDAMKEDDKIEIYTIGFRVDDYPRGEDLMEYCATDQDHFFTADNGDELRRVFETIGNNVTSIYVSQ